MRTGKRSIPASYRLLVGGGTWFPLFFLPGWIGSVAVNVRTALQYGVFAAIGVAFLLPVLIRGDWVQRVLAGVLLVVPVFYLVVAFLLAAGYE